MSLGHGTIRVWRAGAPSTPKTGISKKADSAAKDGSPKNRSKSQQAPIVHKIPKSTKSSPKAPETPKKKSSRPSKAEKKLAAENRASLQHSPTGRQVERVTVCLRPSHHQREYLDHVFGVINSVHSIFSSLRVAPLDRSGALTTLLIHKRELSTRLSLIGDESVIDLLADLLMAWSIERPKDIALEFENASISADQRIFFPSGALGFIEIEYPQGLADLRADHYWRGPFTIFRDAKGYSAAFDLEANISNKLNSTVQRPEKSKGTIPKIILKPGRPLPYISGLRKSTQEPAHRILYNKYAGVVSRGYAGMNWGRLSGWGVSGGLPSLGKNNR